jgi:hypothetical protein
MVWIQDQMARGSLRAWTHVSLWTGLAMHVSQGKMRWQGLQILQAVQLQQKPPVSSNKALGESVPAHLGSMAPSLDSFPEQFSG